MSARRREAARNAVLDALTDAGWTYGLDLWRATGLRAGRLYPALDRLEREGLVESTWAELEPGRKHRRRLYRRVVRVSQ